MDNKYKRQAQWKKRNRKICPNCGEYMFFTSKLCRSCSPNFIKSEKIKNMTLGELKEKYKNSGKHPSWLSSEIRQFCRNWNSKLRKLPCFICGYNKYVELCHKKPISEFDDGSLLKDINSEDNIVVLCPNHHWEFDKGLLKI